MGIDPGSNFLGLACVESRGSGFHWVGHEVLKVNPRGDTQLAERLRIIHEGVRAAIVRWAPESVAVEEIFFAKNAQSALKLGQARGAALAVAAVSGLPLFEYSATKVKQAVTGSGRAEKDQVEKMVRLILGASKNPLVFERADASDALAIAICHLQHARLFQQGLKKELAPPVSEGKTSL